MLVGVVALTAGVGPEVWENVDVEPTAGAFVPTEVGPEVCENAEVEPTVGALVV